MSAPAPSATEPFLKYRGFHPFLFSTDDDARAKSRGHALDMRAESRILNLAKDSFSRTKRWIGETNRKGEAAEFLEFSNAQLAPRERASFLPRDQLALEVERHEDLYNPDPIAGAGASGKLPSGVVFMAHTDLREAVANFDLTPFVEAFVRRLSAVAPEYVWRFGDRFYYRTAGYVWVGDHFEPRRFPVPKQVVMALGGIPPVNAAACVICGKADAQVAPTTDPARPHAHGACLSSGAPALTPQEIEEKQAEVVKEDTESGKIKFRISRD